MGKVVVLVDRDPRDGTVTRAARALLTLARRLGDPVAAVGGATTMDAAAVETLGRFGAGEVWCLAAPSPGEPPAAVPKPRDAATAETVAALADEPFAAIDGSAAASASRLGGSVVGGGTLARAVGSGAGCETVAPLEGSVLPSASVSASVVGGLASSGGAVGAGADGEPVAEPVGSVLPSASASDSSSVGSASASDTDLLAHLTGALTPTAILIPATYRGQETAARLAVRLDSGIITNAVDVRPGPDGPIAVQRCLAGSYLVESSVVRGVPVITVRPEAAVPEPQLTTPVVHTVDLPPSQTPAPTVVATPLPQADRPPLDQADIVVAGGRGIGSRAAFAVLAEVADALGGAVAGSHTAAELGWVPREAQVGLTGKTVHPRLYLACGVSGSVRHRAGMQAAKTVVVIGDDSAAPMFQLADLGVVGDVRVILPALLAEIRTRKAQN